jgi:hypothetical protein
LNPKGRYATRHLPSQPKAIPSRDSKEHKVRPSDLVKQIKAIPDATIADVLMAIGLVYVEGAVNDHDPQRTEKIVQTMREALERVKVENPKTQDLPGDQAFALDSIAFALDSLLVHKYLLERDIDDPEITRQPPSTTTN